jgi:hypothetical protein
MTIGRAITGAGSWIGDKLGWIGSIWYTVHCLKKGNHASPNQWDGPSWVPKGHLVPVDPSVSNPTTDDGNASYNGWSTAQAQREAEQPSE